MSLLSDKSIRERMEKGQLILGGNQKNAKHCAYEFKAARVTFGGIGDNKVSVNVEDLTVPGNAAVIAPSAVAWIRSAERVRVPADYVGIWIQTNSLSRQGLLLLNSTLVEPGYEGYLSAHVVNLSSQAVSISADITIAKLIFAGLDMPAKERIESSKYDNYDSRISELACKANRSFLRIDELIPELNTKLNSAKAAVDKFDAESKDIAAEAKSKVASAVQAEVDKILADAKSTLSAGKQAFFLQAFYGYAVGAALAFAGLYFAWPLLKERDAITDERVLEMIEKANAKLIIDRYGKDIPTNPPIDVDSTTIPPQEKTPVAPAAPSQPVESGPTQ